MPAIGFLHTAEVHRPAFRALLADVAPGARYVDAVDADLLARARAGGITADVRARVAGHLRALAREADAIVCTCSTVGEAAEHAAAGLARPVVRIDRPMAEAAVRAGRRVAVVAALASTLEPTRALLAECAAGRDTELSLAPCPGAWARFEAGDLDGYAARLAEHVRGLAPRADVIVLAQASMAPVEALVADLDVCVLSSPRPAVERAVALAA